MKATLFAAVLVLWTSQADPAVVLSDNFNTETQGLNHTTFANWNVTNGSVDLIGTGFFDFYPGNGNYVDLDGSSSKAGILTSKQSFTLAPGQTFVLTFDLGGSQRGDSNTVDITLAGQGVATLTEASSDPLVLHTVTLTNPGASAISGPLTFHNQGGDNLGAILDNVVLTSPTTNAASEPNSLAVLGLAFAGIVLIGRRRARR